MQSDSGITGGSTRDHEVISMVSGRLRERMRETLVRIAEARQSPA